MTYPIFDFDGLILDTQPIFDNLVRDYALHKGVAPEVVERLMPQLWAKMRGRAKEDNAKTFLTAFKIYTGSTDSPEFAQAAADWFAWRDPMLVEKLPQAQPMPGIQRLIEHLQSHDLPLAIATSSDRRLYEVKIQSHAWLKNVPVVITTNDVTHGKPAPDLFLAAAKKLGADPFQCLVFEDALNGVEGALAAEMSVMFIPPEPSPPEELKSLREKYPNFDRRVTTMLSLEKFVPEDWGLPAYNS